MSEDLKELARIIALDMEVHAALGTTTKDKANAIAVRLKDAWNTRAPDTAQAELLREAVEALEWCVDYIEDAPKHVIATLAKIKGELE